MKKTIKFQIELYYEECLVGWVDSMGEPTNYLGEAGKFEGRHLPMVLNLLEKAYPDYHVSIEQTRS